MIRRVILKFGRAPGERPEAFNPTPVTVFVGPNNSGKSKVLREIHAYCVSGGRDSTDVVLDQVEFEGCSPEQVDEHIRRVTLVPTSGESLNPQSLIIGRRGKRNTVPRDSLAVALVDPNGHAPGFCQWYLTHNTLMLDGRSRIDLIKEQGAGDLSANHTPACRRFSKTTLCALGSGE